MKLTKQKGTGGNVSSWKPKSARPIDEEPPAPAGYRPKSAKPIEPEAAALERDEGRSLGTLSYEDAGPPPNQKVRSALAGATGGFADESLGYIESRAPSLAKSPAEFARDVIDDPADMARQAFSVVVPHLADAVGVRSKNATTYETARNANRPVYKAAVEQEPLANVAGSLAMPLPTSKLKAAGLAGRMGIAALEGGMVGGVSAAGDAEALDDVPAEAAKGLGAGAVLGAPAGAVGHVVSKVPAAIKGFAGTSALKAAGAQAKDLKPIVRREGADALPTKGQALLDEKIVTPLSSLRDVVDNASEVKRRLWQKEMVGALEMADAHGENLFSFAPMVTAGRKRVAEMSKDPALASEAAELNKLLDGYEALGSLPFAQAHKMRASLDQKINRRVDPTSRIQMLEALRGAFDDSLDAQLGEKAGPEALEKYLAAKKLYGTVKDAGRWAKEGVAREEGQRFLSASDYGVGAVGAGIGALTNPDKTPEGLIAGGLKGAALGLGHKVARERGSALLATGFNAVSKALESGAAQRLGRFGPVLQSAAARGPAALLVAHRALSREPEYQDALRALTEVEP